MRRNWGPSENLVTVLFHFGHYKFNFQAKHKWKLKRSKLYQKSCYHFHVKKLGPFWNVGHGFGFIFGHYKINFQTRHMWKLKRKKLYQKPCYHFHAKKLWPFWKFSHGVISFWTLQDQLPNQTYVKAKATKVIPEIMLPFSCEEMGTLLKI